VKSRLVLVLLAVILVPSGALALLGVRAFRGESERARAGLRERAEQAVDAVRAALADELRRLENGEGDALALRFDAGGRLVEPHLERPAGDGPRGPEDPALYRYLEAEVDRLEAGGDRERLAARLTEIGERDGDPWLAAWAWSTLGAIERRAGRDEEARAAWRELIARHPNVRDERGLVRSFTARRFLAERDEELLALYGDVVADHISRDELATRIFKEDLAAELRTRDATSLSDVERLDRERERVRLLQAAWRDGIGDWTARGAPGRTARFERWLIAVAVPPDDASVEGRGGALELERFVTAILARPEITTYAALGFTTRVTGAALAESAPITGVSLSQRDLAAPFSGLTVSVAAEDMAGLLQVERRGFLIVAGLVALAVLFSLGAALATVRAIGREVEAARGREAFVAAVTHELKAPLASIRLLGEVLGAGDVEEHKVREFGQRTAAEAERLSGVITSVLELARLEHENGGTPVLASIDFNDVAREAVETFEPLARERGFEVELRQATAPVNLRADAQALGGAVLNLLDNALKFSDEPHTIEVEVSSTGGQATLAVLDRGRGIAPENTPGIFEPFRRVGDELTRDRPGVGLGLALVQRIARAHGGDARYAPRAGGGSRFVIELPT